MKQKDWPIIIVLALIKFILPFLLIHPVFELQRDEYLYYEQGQHLALGYLENPPLLSWLGSLSALPGGTEFWIKFWPALIGALTLMVTCLLAAEWGGKRFALLLAGLGIITGAFLRVHALFQPNLLDIFSWTLSIYLLTRYINTANKKFIYYFVLALVVGFWSKYSVVFIGAALAVGLLLTQHRRLFQIAATYKALALGILLVLPNVWWQYRHNWPLVHHMQELQETQLQFLSPLDFLKDQLLYLFPVVFVWIAGLVWLFRHRQYRVLGWTYVFVILFLLLGRGKSYYALGIYPMLLAAGAVAWEKFTFAKRWLRYAIPVVILVLTLPFVPLLLPFARPQALADFYQKTGFAKTGLLRWEDLRDHPLPQDFADMLGWKELTQKAERFYDSLDDATKAGVKIYCRNYGQAGALKFYGKEKDFRQKVFSDNGSFLLWIHDNVQFQHLIFIGWRMPEKDDEVFNHFEKVTVIDSVTNPLSRQYGDKIIFFQNIDTSGLRIAQQGLQEMKAEFER